MEFPCIQKLSDNDLCLIWNGLKLIRRFLLIWIPEIFVKTMIDELRLFTPWLTHFETLQYMEPGTSSLTQADYQAQMPQAFEPWHPERDSN